MATPNNFLSGYSQSPYPHALNSWGLPPVNPYALNTHLRYPFFQQPFNYSYMFPQQNYYAIPQLAPFNPNSSPAVVQTAQIKGPAVVEEKTIKGINKI